MSNIICFINLSTFRTFNKYCKTLQNFKGRGNLKDLHKSKLDQSSFYPDAK